jgi:hypothetical protein
MKQETLDILRRDLNKNKKYEESWDKNKDFIYEIEFLPVLTKRDKDGLLQEITNSSTRLLFISEKGE